MIRLKNKTLMPSNSLSFIIIFLLIGCASAPTQTTSQESTPLKATEKTPLDRIPDKIAEKTPEKTNEELRTIIQNLQIRINTLETKLSQIQSLQENAKPSVILHPAEHRGSKISETPIPSDPEGGFINDASVQDFRKAMILFQAQKNAEAALALSTFVENYPDHPLAGSAQFFVGESYFRQKEYKLALHEYERVLTTYDRSPHISFTLQRIADTEDYLQMKEAATKHRQLLASLFPHSPAVDADAITKKIAPLPTDALKNAAHSPANESSRRELKGPTPLDAPPPPTAPISAKEYPAEISEKLKESNPQGSKVIE